MEDEFVQGDTQLTSNKDILSPLVATLTMLSCRFTNISINKEDLAQHHNEYHQGSNQCCIFLKQLSRPSELKVHHGKHSGIHPHECQYCKRYFTRASILKKHLSNLSCINDWVNSFFIGNEQQTSICSECQKSFHNPANLRRHQITHAETREIFKCEVDGCGKQYTCPGSFKSHKKTHGKAVSNLTCETCGKVLAKKHNLRLHLLTHTDYRPRHRCPHPCCPKEYVGLQCLTQHVNEMHPSTRMPEAELVSLTCFSGAPIPVVAVDLSAIKGIQWILPANKSQEPSVEKSDERLLENGRDVSVPSDSTPCECSE